MAGSQASTEAIMFNNPFLSDVTIHQICDGVTKEYHAHKAVLCVHSKWFTTMFSSPFKEASDRIIQVYDDDPTYFEMMLKYFYTLKWRSPLYDTWSKSERPYVKYLAPIGVYALADKYDCEILRDSAVQNFPVSDLAPILKEVFGKMVEAHYSRCVRIDDPMGRKITAMVLVKSIQYGALSFVKSDEFERLAKDYPVLCVDLLLQCRKGDGRLF